MNKIERIKMVKAMEFIARQINCEDIFDGWLSYGVADGDVEYGDICISEDDEEILSYYIKDEEFADLMNYFIYIMRKAYKHGGLYCDEICSDDIG